MAACSPEPPSPPSPLSRFAGEGERRQTTRLKQGLTYFGAYGAAWVRTTGRDATSGDLASMILVMRSRHQRRHMVIVARNLRQQAVRSERVIWEALRDRQLDGVRFKRQQPFDRFVVDFFAPADRLVVEVDGSFHDGREDLDEIRQRALEARGLRFVRVSSNEVERALPAVLNKIRRALTAEPPLPLRALAGREGEEADTRGNLPSPAKRERGRG